MTVSTTDRITALRSDQRSLHSGNAIACATPDNAMFIVLPESKQVAGVVRSNETSHSHHTLDFRRHVCADIRQRVPTNYGGLAVQLHDCGEIAHTPLNGALTS